YGTNGFIRLSPSYLPEHLIQASVGHRASHNTMILTLVEQGFAGTFLYLVFYFSSLLMLERTRRSLSRLEPKIADDERRKTRHLIMHCIALQAAIICLLVQSVFVDRLFFEVMYWLGAFAVALTHIAGKLIAQVEPVADIADALPANSVHRPGFSPN
ncbi:MAG: hypothetical protein C4576_27085, partial [Desulfobacteraceae bacterium]